MAMMIKYKVKDVATDLNVSTKDVIAVLEQYCNVTKKTMTSLDENELNIVFDYFTQKNSVDNFNAYFAVREKAIEKAEQEVKDRKAEEKRKREEAKDTLRPESAKKANKPAPKKEEKPQPKQEKQEKVVDLNSEIKSRRGQGRVIDTSAVEINVDRYNEKYDRMAFEKVKNENQMSSKKQKINQRSQQRRRQGKRELSRKPSLWVQWLLRTTLLTLIQLHLSLWSSTLRLKKRLLSQSRKESSTTARTTMQIL